MDNKKIVVFGHKGLVGSALVKEIKQGLGVEAITIDRKNVDLSNFEQVDLFFRKVRPDWIFLAAAKVGGIGANSQYPVEFLLENLKIQNNVIECAYKYKTKKLLFLGSSCIYPREAPQPIKESYLLTAPLEETNEAYALAKIAGLKLCYYYNKEYGSNFITVMPCNVYGPNDNYHTHNSHVFPALIRKIHEAKKSNIDKIVLWGSGRPLREFIFSEDLARACLFLMKNKTANEVGDLINIGSSKDLTIKDLAETMMDVIGFKGHIEFDPSKPDGTFRKLIDSSKITDMGWRPEVSLKEGIKLTYEDFLNNPSTKL